MRSDGARNVSGKYGFTFIFKKTNSDKINDKISDKINDKSKW